MRDGVAKRLDRIGWVMAGAAAIWACSMLFDAATSIADDIETGAKRLQSSSDSELTIVHTPQTSRGDCPDAYRCSSRATR